MKSKKTKNQEKRGKRKLSAAKRVADHKSGSRYLKLPEGARFWQNKKVDEEVTIDVVPYAVTAEGKKFVGNTYAEGDLNFERTYYLHSYCVGPGTESVICAAKTFGKKCYVCEWLNKHPLPLDASKEEKDARYKYAPKCRQLWNVRVAGEEDKGCQVFDVSIKLFGEALFTKIGGAKGSRKEKFENFADPEDGSSIIVTPKTKSMGVGQPFVTYESVDIVDRGAEVGDEWVEKAHDLDAMLQVPDYEKVKDMMLAGGGEKDEEEVGGGGDDDDLPDAPCEEGDAVEFKHKDKTLSGTATKVDAAEALVTVKTAGGKILKIDFDDVIPAAAEEDDDEDQDEEGDESEDDSEEDQEEEEDQEIVKGGTVTWKSKKSGRTLTGKITSLNKNSGLALVLYDPEKKPVAVDIEDLTIAAGKEEAITTLRATKKGGKADPKKRRLVDDDEDSIF